MSDKRPLFEFRPFAKPAHTVGAVIGGGVMFAMLFSGQHLAIAYTAYLPAALLPFALTYRARQVSQAGEKAGLFGMAFEEFFLALPKLPRRADMPRLIIAALNWLVVLPALIYLAASVARVWS